MDKVVAKSTENLMESLAETDGLWPENLTEIPFKKKEKTAVDAVGCKGGALYTGMFAESASTESADTEIASGSDDKLSLIVHSGSIVRDSSVDGTSTSTPSASLTREEVFPVDGPRRKGSLQMESEGRKVADDTSSLPGRMESFSAEATLLQPCTLKGYGRDSGAVGTNVASAAVTAVFAAMKIGGGHVSPLQVTPAETPTVQGGLSRSVDLNEAIRKLNLKDRFKGMYRNLLGKEASSDRGASAAEYESLEMGGIRYGVRGEFGGNDPDRFAEETVETVVRLVSENDPLLSSGATLTELRKEKFASDTTLDIGEKSNLAAIAGGSGIRGGGNNNNNGRNELGNEGAAGDGRETWGHGTDFLLSIIGFAVDLANVWRFPYLCYRNGGGAFLIPYFLMLVFGAVPLFYMELILGQSNRQGPISVWRACPLFKGIGFCAVMVAFYVSFYYNVIIAWALYFLFSSMRFTSHLPWVFCNNTWNTIGCTNSSFNVTLESLNFSANTVTNDVVLHHSPASEYFHRSVLEMQFSSGLDDIGWPKWQMVACLFAVYFMLYLSLFKGVKSTGRVVYATATIPYVVLSILLVRGLMLPGSMSGIVYYLQPKISRLYDTQVWVDAAVQVFYSVGAGFGVHLSYASYNDYNNNCYRDCLITTAVNCFTSFFSGFVIFTYLGFMSFKEGIPISSVATEGPGLVFQVYPEAIATLPGSSIWAMLFFFMLIMLGIDSAMGGMECVITGLMDEFSYFFAGKKYAREIFTFVAVLVSFCISTINVTPGGIYMFHLFDTYSAGISLLCSALFEAIAVSWFYGLERFTGDVELMMGQRPGLYWRICWKFISPSFIIGVVVFGLVYHEPLRYNDYVYPQWAEYLGWGLALSSIMMIPIFMFIQMIRTPGTFKERLAYNITPVEDHERMYRTNRVSRFTRRHWLYV